MSQAASGCVPGVTAVTCDGTNGASGTSGSGTMITTPAPTCSGGVCTCAPGFALCNNVCVSLTSDPLNCGACGASCAGNACNGGQCDCPAGSTRCNGVCSDTQSDLLNCGGCGIACVAGQVCDAAQCVSATSPTCTTQCGGGRACVAGQCQCPAGQSECGGACADLQTDAEHCGTCETACGTGQLCSAGSCTCPGGQTACGDSCVDTQTSLAHCGGCDQACSAGESCTAGACRGAIGADGCAGQARAISITQIAAYQSLKIPVMQNGAAVATAMRPAAVVQGRDTLFRVFVKPDAGFVARELSARLTLKNSTTEDQYFAKQTPHGESTDADSASTFMIFVPPDKIQADTRYAVELVECGMDPGTGSVSNARFPASGDAALEARETGTLKVAIVPVSANSMLPDTSESALDVYRKYFMAMYPITSIELSVRPAITTTTPINWNNLLEQIRKQRQTDAPAGDVYYYGFLKPAATFREYCAQSCTAGVGYVTTASQAGTRVAVGLAYADATSASTMAHEVGHNHGRNHAPCAPGGNISGVDNQYPYSGAKLGTWGYDPRSRLLLDPSQGTDIMGYCNMKWVSDYTYKGLVDRVATINVNYERFVAQESLASYRVLLLDDAGPRWSFPIDEPTEAFGEPMLADVLDVSGSLLDTITVYRTEIGDNHNSWIVLVPEPQLSWNALRVNGWPAISFRDTTHVVAP